MTPGYPVFLQLGNQPALIIGGDDEAADRSGRLVASGARVTVVWPTATARLQALAVRRAVYWYARPFTPTDARGCRLVILTARDPALAAALHAQGRRDGFLFGATDQPAESDFAHPAIHDAGPVRMAISTAGTAPTLARVLRNQLATGLDARFAAFAERIARVRAGADRPERAARIERALEGFAVDVSVRYPSWEREPGDPQ